ncbi:CGNR zinc finger domain-containing protein [Kribbella qitaiheensis]|uniref:CGNR zinc finger domain-containing protein n=1 Tax=Kribbella qitaiheensis TaxID=1544730 RepID=A0A7G6X2I8_9ACTN|nr:CGNR zinc finger domain-containing protein [Kribbella qitaiheensis]QNE20453.1 CGNR zinc finger domain-containing protein [Kribbella qitaiheensis]
MDATDHLKASLEAAVALANATGAESNQGRAREALDQATVEAVLRLTTNQPLSIDEVAVGEFATGGEQIYRALVLLAEEETDAAASALNALLASTRAAPMLRRHPESAWHLHFASEGVSVATGWLAEFGTAAAMLLGSDELDRLRSCAAGRCDNIFLDATRNHRQRFCSTACQNRTKVAAFRSRGTQT